MVCFRLRHEVVCEQGSDTISCEFEFYVAVYLFPEDSKTHKTRYTENLLCANRAYFTLHVLVESMEHLCHKSVSASRNMA